MHVLRPQFVAVSLAWHGAAVVMLVAHDVRVEVVRRPESGLKEIRCITHIVNAGFIYPTRG